MRFERVSERQFAADLQKYWGCSRSIAEVIADKPLTLPKRATAGSAGYDFYSPIDVIMRPGDSQVIPTGIRAKLDPGQVLLIFPRSGLGFKYRIQLDNTCGIIDSDYFFADNEGHIMIKVSNASYQAKECAIRAGDRFAQGIIVNYAVAEDDDIVEQRTGGMGSTGF